MHRSTALHPAHRAHDGIDGAARRLHRDVQGAVLRPGDAGYDAGRRTIDPAFDARPALIVAADGAADVRAAVVAAREYDLPFAVQATGHGTRVPADGGILVRTGGLGHVLVDPERRVARVGAGARWADVLAAAAPFGLAPLCGSSPDVGVAGYTLGGGSAGSPASTASPPTASCGPRSSRPRARSSSRAPTSTPTCSGRCAAAAGASAS